MSDFCPDCFHLKCPKHAAPARAPQEPPADQNEQGWADLQASGGLPEAQEAAAKFDIMERLHGILTVHGISSRSTHLGLTTDLIRWAADACRQSQPKSKAQEARPAQPLDLTTVLDGLQGLADSWRSRPDYLPMAVEQLEGFIGICRATALPSPPAAHAAKIEE